MARFPSINNEGQFEAPEVQNHIKELVTGTTDGITVDTSSGKRIMVGDHVIEYDSGWRDLTEYAQRNVLSGRILMRRTLHEVALHVDNVVIAESGTNTLIYISDTSFRPAVAVPGFWNQGIATRPEGDFLINIGGYAIFYRIPDNDNPINLTVSMPARNDLPTSLPGNPA